jgi:hypothetical protein
MPVKVTKEEKLVELAIEKAKQVIQEAKHLGTLPLDEDVMGEEVKLTRPKKTPEKPSLPKTSNIDGDADLLNEG